MHEQRSMMNTMGGRYKKGRASALAQLTQQQRREDKRERRQKFRDSCKYYNAYKFQGLSRSGE